LSAAPDLVQPPHSWSNSTKGDIMIQKLKTNLVKINYAIAMVGFLSCTIASATPVDDLAKEKQLSQEYLHQMAMEPNTQVIESGIILRPIFESGTNQFAKVTDTVKVSYHLVDREGKVVDESITSDELAVFPLNKLIKCWQMAIPKISIGSFYKISCPSDVAYGDKGAGDGAIKPGAALTFRLTVYGIQ
jgi:FKBP-type peptidyl-prolyl cis-trans isomerase FkpA